MTSTLGVSKVQGQGEAQVLWPGSASARTALGRSTRCIEPVQGPGPSAEDPNALRAFHRQATGGQRDGRLRSLRRVLENFRGFKLRSSFASSIDGCQE